MLNEYSWIIKLLNTITSLSLVCQLLLLPFSSRGHALSTYCVLSTVLSALGMIYDISFKTPNNPMSVVRIIIPTW